MLRTDQGLSQFTRKYVWSEIANLSDRDFIILLKRLNLYAIRLTQVPEGWQQAVQAIDRLATALNCSFYRALASVWKIQNCFTVSDADIVKVATKLVGDHEALALIGQLWEQPQSDKGRTLVNRRVRIITPAAMPTRVAVPARV